jgi:hypothetical protein
MEMGLTVVVVLVVLAVVAAVAFVAVQSRRRREEQQRIEAAEQRHEAEIRSASAQRREAEASERAARADHEQAQAREQAARARQDREVAESRHATADRIDPDRPDDRGRDTADPAARTDDLRLGSDRKGGGPDVRPEQAAADGGRAPEGQWHAASAAPPGQPASPPGDGKAPDRPAGSAGATAAQPGGPTGGHGERVDPAARTDDLRMGEGRREPSTAQDAGGQSIPRWQTEGGWHGPSASGGFPAVKRTRREPSPSGAEPAPAGPRHAEDRPAPDTAAPTGIGEPSAPGPAVPAQRTGEHDRDEHTGPVRALADRLLRRRG